MEEWLAQRWMGDQIDTFYQNGYTSVDDLRELTHEEVSLIIQLFKRPGDRLKMRLMLDELILDEAAQDAEPEESKPRKVSVYNKYPRESQEFKQAELDKLRLESEKDQDGDSDSEEYYEGVQDKRQLSKALRNQRGDDKPALTLPVLEASSEDSESDEEAEEAESSQSRSEEMARRLSELEQAQRKSIEKVVNVSPFGPPQPSGKITRLASQFSQKRVPEHIFSKGTAANTSRGMPSIAMDTSTSSLSSLASSAITPALPQTSEKDKKMKLSKLIRERQEMITSALSPTKESFIPYSPSDSSSASPPPPPPPPLIPLPPSIPMFLPPSEEDSNATATNRTSKALQRLSETLSDPPPEEELVLKSSKGTLVMTVDKKTGPVKERVFQLSGNDYLFLFEDEKEIHPCGRIPLKDVEISSSSSDPNYSGDETTLTLSLVTDDKKKFQYLLGFASVEVREEWNLALEQIKAFLAQKDLMEHVRSLLETGAHFRKFKRGRGKNRTLWVLPGLDRLYWGSQDKLSCKGYVMLSDIVEVRAGCHGSKKPQHSFTIVCKDRLLELEAASVPIKTSWVHALHLLSEMNKNKIE